jgi:lambda family phage portal protein
VTVFEQIDRIAAAVDYGLARFAPSWALRRSAARAQLQYGMSAVGYDVPRGSSSAMRGLDAYSNSADYDTIPKLEGVRALQKDLFMSSAISPAILRRMRTLGIGSGLTVSPRPDAEALGIDPDAADVFAKSFQREYGMWADSFSADFDGFCTGFEQQGLVYFNMLLSGDCFWMPVWRRPTEAGFPYELSIKLIDADLVRDPSVKGGLDIEGGVEKDASGQVVAVWVWDRFVNDLSYKQAKCRRVPVYDSRGRRQIYHVVDPERLNQRRGLGRLANVAKHMKQVSRLGDAQLMSALVASYFTVFVKDATGMGIGPMPNANLDTGDVAKKWDDGSVSLGPGNILTLPGNKDVTLASPNKSDQNFNVFFDTLWAQACAAGGIPVEQALMRYTSSYTAARAAANDVWVARLADRQLIVRRFCQPIYTELLIEAILRNRISAPGFFRDYSNRSAWSKAQWIGSGRGSLNPLDEAKAHELAIKNVLGTHEEIYTAETGGRWEDALDRERVARQKIRAAGLEPSDAATSTDAEPPFVAVGME